VLLLLLIYLVQVRPPSYLSRVAYLSGIFTSSLQRGDTVPLSRELRPEPDEVWYPPSLYVRRLLYPRYAFLKDGVNLFNKYLGFLVQDTAGLYWLVYINNLQTSLHYLADPIPVSVFVQPPLPF
jgi:hypothetical protein